VINDNLFCQNRSKCLFNGEEGKVSLRFLVGEQLRKNIEKKNARLKF